MTRGRWRHMSTLDIDLEVLAVTPTPTAWKCAVAYVNRHLEEVHAYDSVIIQRQDFWKWSKV